MPNNKCISLKKLKDYKTGRTSEPERIAIAGHLPTCELCTYTASNYSAINEQELEEDLPILKKAITNTLFESKRRQRRQLLSKMAAAVLFLVTAALTFQFFINPSNSSLYEQHYQAYKIPDAIQKTNSAPLAEAIAKYNKTPYQKPTDPIPGSFDTNPQERALTQLLTGLTDLENNKLPAAIAQLEKAQKSKTSYSEDAAWYLALAHLKQESFATAKEYLTIVLANKNGAYYENALALKAKLDK